MALPTQSTLAPTALILPFLLNASQIDPTIHFHQHRTQRPVPRRNNRSVSTLLKIIRPQLLIWRLLAINLLRLMKMTQLPNMGFLYIDPHLQHLLQPRISLHLLYLFVNLTMRRPCHTLPSTRAYDHGRKTMTTSSLVTSWTLILVPPGRP